MTLNKKKKRNSNEEKQQNKQPIAPSISYFTLYRYTSKKDLLLILTALLSSVVAGLTLPYSISIVADVFHKMVQYANGLQKGNKDAATFLDAIHLFAIKYFCLGVITFICGYLGSAFMEIAAINQIFKIRSAYLQAALNQDFSYYDTRVTGDFASKMTEDIIKVEEGIGGKLSKFVYYISLSLGCLSMALAKGWKLALLCLLSTPLSMFLVGLTGFFANRLAKTEAAESSKASAVAEEVFSSIRTVYAFSGQQKEIERYREPLRAARKLDIKKEIFMGLTNGLLFLSVFCSYALSFYIGVYLITVDPEHYNAGVMFAVFFGVIQGLFGLGLVGSYISTFGSARGAGAQIFSVIDNKPTINSLLNKGTTLSDVKGIIEFRDVRFTYPSRPDNPVLRGINLVMKRGQSVAFVGKSGGGKSTIVQLILRYYDVNGGQVLIDGHDVRELSVRWLRAQIGLVGQEPVLFNTTVRENIRYGREDASDADIEAAARQANIHHFIIKLPQGYNTLVGERGAAISGGQKQRIAIARALVRNPTILLLDEATSALDRSSEFKVQKALDEASKGRTTVIVAHRLSTIRNVDYIYVLDGGNVAEKGNHEQLMELHGLYYNMLSLQQPQLNTPQTPLTSISERGTIDVNSAEDLQSKKEGIEQPKSAEGEEILKPPKMSFWQVVRLNQPEWTWITIGSVSSIVIGFAMPLYILAFGNLFGALSSDDPEYLLRKALEVGVTFVLIGLVLGLFSFIAGAAFGVAGARLTERIRLRMFENLMTQQIAFYDDHANSTGSLCSRLSTEAAYIRRATGQRIGVFLQGVGSVLLSLCLSIIFEYRIGLWACLVFPIIGLLIYVQGKLTQKEYFGSTQTIEKSNKIAVEAVANVRTVASLGREWRFLDEYTKALRPALGPAKTSAHVNGLVAGTSQSMFIFLNCATLTYGSHIIVSDGVPYENILVATQSLQTSAMQVESAFSFSPDFQKGINAACKAVEVMNCKPTMHDPEEAMPFEGTGAASFSKVDFRYPTRTAEKVLRNLDLQIFRGKSIALVGESGCGKSTMISLLQRFYDPEKGVVALDGIPLPQLRFVDIRGTLGLVSQEPVLFDRTVGQNIAYGDNTRSPSADEIIAAAKEANIHSFIETLPQKYDTRIGSKGVQLSGGQKQRLAIARALVRRPKILLLDEATSALDTESEKVVQEALDRAKAGRTCVTIAHRLSTIVDSDIIYVFRRGRVVESGTHEELLNLNGAYHDLYSK